MDSVTTSSLARAILLSGLTMSGLSTAYPNRAFFNMQHGAQEVRYLCVSPTCPLLRVSEVRDSIAVGGNEQTPGVLPYAQSGISAGWREGPGGDTVRESECPMARSQ